MKAKTVPIAKPSHHAPIQEGLFLFMVTDAFGWTNIPKNTEDNKNPITAAVNEVELNYVKHSYLYSDSNKKNIHNIGNISYVSLTELD